MKKFLLDKLAAVLVPAIRRLVPDPRYFELWQAHGTHILPVHYDSPIPDTRELMPEIWSRRSEMPGIRMNGEGQATLLSEFVSLYSAEFCSFPSKPPAGQSRFYLGNSSFGSVDAEILYCMIRHFKPSRVIEIGSGYSTLLIVEALRENRKSGVNGRLTAIEPYPRNFLRDALCDIGELAVQPVQQVPLDQFTSLQANDILFIDSSHVCKIGSDVQYEFLEILPRLTAGVVVHAHDIFLPAEYPRNWAPRERRFWNEQYILQALLCGNRGFDVLWAGSWMHINHPDMLANAFNSYDPRRDWPASFWLRRVVD